MNIATALNRKYIRYTIVMLTSLCENNHAHIEAYLLHTELLDSDIEFIRDNLNRYDISINPLKVDKELFDDKLPRNRMWTVEMYYRLLLSEILPENVDRILYLDVDLIVNKDISEFYEVEFEGDEIIACVDEPMHRNTSPKQKEMFAERFACGYRYFNSGVMLMNIGELRGRYNFDTYLAAMEEWNYGMTAPDQDILNYVHWQKVGYVNPDEFDLFARIAHNAKRTYEWVKETCYIIHFAGDKPWNSENVHFDIEKLWWDYAKKTSVYTELLEEFLLDTLTNDNVEAHFKSLMAEKEQLSTELAKSMEINNKLLAMLKR